MKRISLFILTLSFAVIAASQNSPQGRQPQFDPHKFQQIVEEKLSHAANLTPEERTAFFSLYNELRNKQRDMGRQIQQLKKNSDNKEPAQIVNKINSIKIDMAKLESDYYKRMLKTIPPEKVLKVIKAEDEVYRSMVQRRSDEQNRRHEKGQGKWAWQKRPHGADRNAVRGER